MKKYFLTLALLALPLASNAQVLISEIAWMGTDTDANNEWIELYNLNTTEIDITGWTIEGSISVALSGILPPHGVGVLERTDDTTLPGTALLIYTGALPNEAGGTLTLKDASGGVVDQAVGGANWENIGGSNTVPKKTPQRTRTGAWVTATPTPGAENAQASDVVVTATTSTTDTTTTSHNTIQRSSGGSSSSKRVLTNSTVVEKNIDPVLTLTTHGPKIAYVHQRVSFDVVPEGLGKTVMNSLSYAWNFGDTNTAVGKEVSHVFAYPGEYIVVVEGTFAKQHAVVRQEVKVLPVSFTIERTPAGDVKIGNEANYEVDIGGFSLRGGTSFIFPKFTFMKANGTLIVPKGKIGTSQTLVLHDGEKVAVTAHSDIPLAYVPQKISGVTKSAPKEVAVAEVPSIPVVEPTSATIRIGDGVMTKEENRGVFGRLFGSLAQLFGS